VQGQQFSIQNLTTTSSSVAEGSTATLQGDVSNLDGAGFTLTVNWGDGQGPQSYPFPGGPASFSVSHYYGNNGTAFQQTYDIGATVTTSDDRTSGGGTSIQGQNAPPVILGLDAPSGFATSGAGAQLNLFATANDPGASDALSYRWDARQDGNEISEFPVTDASQGGTDTCSLDASSCNHDDITVTLTVQDNDRSTASTSVTLTYDASAPGGNPSSMFQPDQPTVSITETDPGGSVWAGDLAHFQVSLAGNMPDHGTVTVNYRTQPGEDTDPRDYRLTSGTFTFTYNSQTQSYNSPQSFTVSVYSNAHIGDFEAALYGAYDAAADKSWNCVGGGGSATALVQNYDIQLFEGSTQLDDSIDKTGCVKPDVVKAGQVLTLSVANAPAGATIVFDYPAFPAVVESFDDSNAPASAGPVPAGTHVTNPNARTLAFTQGGNGQSIEVQVMWTDPATQATVERDLWGCFNVEAPSVTATATPATMVQSALDPAGGPNTASVWFEMDFNASGPPGWQYQWVQVIVSDHVSETWPSTVHTFDGTGLDKSYPYANGLNTRDDPGIGMPAETKQVRQFTADMWLMAEPTGVPDATFVPLLQIRWSFGYTATYPLLDAQGRLGASITKESKSPQIKTPMAPWTQFPQWSRTAPNIKDIKNWKVTKR